MRWGPLLLAPLLLAGCAQPPTQPQPAPSLALPPSLLLDRTANGTLQLYVHAKHGNVRYDFVNVSRHADLAVNATALGVRTPSLDTYAVDLDLGLARANLTVEAVDGTLRYRWSGRVALNETARPPTLTLQLPDARDGYAPPRDASLPFETLLAREVP